MRIVDESKNVPSVFEQQWKRPIVPTEKSSFAAADKQHWHILARPVPGGSSHVAQGLTGHMAVWRQSWYMKKDGLFVNNPKLNS